jgi:serine/threonine protein phosphatase PrpC
MPLKYYYIINCFRYEKPQAGRSREFFQFGTEMFGAKGAAADFTVISLAHTLLRELGITGIKPMLTQFLGMEPAASGPGTGHSASGAGAKPGALCFRPSHHELPAERGTTFLLCTDGLTDMVSEDRILTILTSGSSPEESVRKLRDEALQRGGRDNITIIVASLT